MKLFIKSRYPALASRDYRLSLIGNVVSQAGTAMANVGLAWQLYDMTGSPYVLALLGATRVVPIIIFSLISGALVDAHNRKKIIYLSQIFQAAGVLAMGLFTATGTATPGNLLIINTLLTALYTIDSPARQAFVPKLIPREHYGNAVSLNVTGYNTAIMAGPAIAGFLIAGPGVAWVYFLDSVSFLLLFGAVWAIRTSGAIEGEKPKPSWASVRQGLSFVRHHTLIWSTMILDFFSTFFGEATILLPVFAKDILHVGPQHLGFLYAAPFAGATIVGMIASTLGRRLHTGKILLGSIVGYGLGSIVFGMSTNYVLSLCALAIVGAGDGMSAIIRNIIRQLSTPDHIRGRMTSINMMFYTGGPRLGEVEAGLVAGLFGAPAAVVTGGVGVIIVVAIMTKLMPALVEYQESYISSK